MKIHLKNSAKDHLTLCRIWADKNWILKNAFLQSSDVNICLLCAKEAAPRPKPRDKLDERERLLV